MTDKPQERRADYLLIGGMAEKIDTVHEGQKQIVKTLVKIDDKVDKHGEEIAALNVKAGIWGAIAGLAMAVPLYLKWALISKGGH